MGNTRGGLSLFNIMLNLMLSHALSMLYLCLGYGVSMAKILIIWRAGRALFGKIGKMRRFRKIRKRKLMINASSRRMGIPGGLFNIMLNLILSPYTILCPVRPSAYAPSVLHPCLA